MSHVHDWKLAFTQTSNGIVIASHYHCNCDEWKVEDGGEPPPSMNGTLGSLGKSGVPR